MIPSIKDQSLHYAELWYLKIGGAGKASLYKLFSSHKLTLLLELIGLGTTSKNSAGFSLVVPYHNEPGRNIDITAASI